MSVDLRCCSIAELTESLEPDSVDSIICDPPYPREFIPVFGELRTFAERVLKPGGSLVVMSGHAYLPEVVALLESEILSYIWTTACLTPGGNNRHWPHRVFIGWKPIFVYAKGEPTQPGKHWIQDTILSRRDKRFHEWGQSVFVFEELVSIYSRHGELVADPFLGAGTTACAAVLLGRNFVGCDIDAECITKTEARLSAVDEYLRAQRALISA